MSIDLTQFHQVFYEESFEGLDLMEAALMEVDPNNIDSETINAIFRSAHSIKGGSATFGFSSVSEFTHDLETILDQIRSGKRGLTTEDVNIFLKSVDCMREMLQLLQANEESHTALSVELKGIFSQMLSSEPITELTEISVEETVDAEGADTFKHDNGVAAVLDKPPLDAEDCLWKIQFVPEKSVLRTGNDVVRIFRELEGLGHIQTCICSWGFEGLASLDPEECYLSWGLTFQSSATKKAIEEVFEWVADESEIVIEKIQSHQRWLIYFEPDRNMLRSGNEPLRLFSALKEMGELTVQPIFNALPSLKLLDHEECYLSWDLVLVSDSAEEASIHEVFEWVADEAKLSVACDGEASNYVTEQISDTADTTDDSADITSSMVDVNLPEVNVSKKSVGSAENGAAVPKKIVAAKKSTTDTGSIRVGIDKVDNLINMVGELVITQSMLGQLGSDFEVERIPSLMEGLSQLEQNTRELQESVMRIRMLPISFAFSRFPRMVRDLGQNLGKQLHLEMIGDQTELDKTVMEKIGDPLVHLVRNAVDHGIEAPEERLAEGKPAVGTITLNAYHQGGNVVIEIADDGQGLDREKIVAKAVEKNILSLADAGLISEEATYDLIFQPGFSTAKNVSDVSGRGVGMDVVRRNIQSLNGTVEISSHKGKGSTITIRLPLTLAILDGQLVRVGTNTYIFPLVSIVESLQCSRELISRVAGGCDVFRLRDDYVPIIELHKTFSVSPGSTDLEQLLMVVVEADGEKVGIVVDELLAQQQVVIKSLEKNYKRIDGVSGATILGDGTVAFIIDISGVVKLAGEKFGIAHQLTKDKNSKARIEKIRMVG